MDSDHKPLKLKPVRPIATKAFKVKFLPKSVHPPPPDLSDKPVWNNDIIIRKATRSNKGPNCTVEDVEVPCPDYICFNASRYQIDGQTAVHKGDVVVMKKNYKPAPWCDPVRHVRQVQRCTDISSGRPRERVYQLPSNYQTVYIDKDAPQQMIAAGSVKNGCPLYAPALIKQEDTQEPKRTFYENIKANPIDQKGQLYRKIEGYSTSPY